MRLTPVSSTATSTATSTEEHLNVLGAVASITADAGDTDGEFTVVDMLVPPGFENGLHSHEQSEVIHVLDGEIQLHVEGEDSRLGPGATGYVAGSEKHGFRVDGEDAAQALFVFTPAGVEDFFRAAGEPVADRSLPEPREVSEDDLEALFALGEEHGFDFYGPLPVGE